MSALLPRLDRESVEGLVAALQDGNGPTPSPAQLRGEALVLPSRVTYARSGGAPATAGQLGAVRERIECIARDCGWPDGRNGAAFDARVAADLASDPLFRSGDALRDDTWAGVATCLLPHLVLWRFGHRPERFHGGIRNTFQRLWIRGRLLDRGEAAGESRWVLLDELGEDALVALTERPALAADRRLARAIAEGWSRSARRAGRPAMEPVMRQAIMQLRLLNEIRLLSLLDDHALGAVIDSEFLHAEQQQAQSSAMSSRTGCPARKR